MTKYDLKAILTDDQSTTYNLALLRAFTDVALDQPEVIEASFDGKIRVPSRALADLWITYYFPLIRDNVPQMHSGRLMAFHELYERIIRKNKLTAFEQIQEKGVGMADLRSEISRTILRAPATHAKDGKGERLCTEFKAPDSKHWSGLEIKLSLWNELQANGPAIREAIQEEWTKVSASFAAAKVAHKTGTAAKPDSVKAGPSAKKAAGRAAGKAGEAPRYKTKGKAEN